MSRTPDYGEIFEPESGLRRVEAAAQRCLGYCRKRLGLGDVPLPLPVDEWIETALGIRFGVSDLSYLGSDVLGAAFIRGREIAVSQLIANDARFRFTCAHELGHFVLHSRIRERFTDGDLPSLEEITRIERHADRFAAAMLMPIPVLERELLRTAEGAGLEPGAALARLAAPTDEACSLWRALFIPGLTRSLGVSRAALVLRCRGLFFRQSPEVRLMSASVFGDLFRRNVGSPAGRTDEGAP